MVCVTGAGGSGTKPAGKGIDMDAVGNINGVPVYEFDLDGLKVEDKPWRKPGNTLLLLCFYMMYSTVYWLFCSSVFLFLYICNPHDNLLCEVRIQ